MSPDRPVLVVDDDDSARAKMVEFLQAKGFTVAEATNGLEGLLAVKRLRPIAVVIDLAIPRLGCLEAVKRIRRFDASIRIVIVTGLSDDAAIQEALAFGARAVLSKPIDLAELDAAVSLEGSPLSVAAESDSSPTPSPRSRILIADANDALRKALAEFLKGRGFSVKAIETGGAAVRAIAKHTGDIVLLDIEMPDFTPVEQSRQTP